MKTDPSTAMAPDLGAADLGEHGVDLERVEGTQSIRRALHILQTLAIGQEEGMRITDIADALRLRSSTVHRILRVLVEEGVAEKNQSTRRYMIGHETSLLGLARTTNLSIKRIAEPYLTHVAHAVKETVFLTIRSRLDSVCVDRKTGCDSLKVLSINIGSRRPLGVTVGGLAILSFMPAGQAHELIAANERRLEQYKCASTELRKRIEETKNRGYAYVDAGIRPGTSAIAVAVLDRTGYPVASISTSVITARLSRERLPQIAAVMQEQARLLTSQL